VGEEGEGEEEVPARDFRRGGPEEDEEEEEE